MRTTLTFERDVAKRLAREMRRTGKSLKVIVNEALRLGLGRVEEPQLAPRFEVEPHAFGFAPDIDLDRLNQLADLMEAQSTGQRLKR